MLINRIGANRFVQNLCDKMGKPNNYARVNSVLPTAESIFATGCYLVSIKTNKDIPQERKKPLYWQSIIPCLAGVSLSRSLNKLIESSKNALIHELKNRSAIKNIENITRGLQVLAPLVITSTVMRFIVPVLSVPISTLLSQHKSNA